MVEQISVLRIVATPQALDDVQTDPGTIAMRIAPDELLLIEADEVAVDDPHAIVFRDTAWAGLWLDAEESEQVFLEHCAWKLPDDRPTFAQGMVAHLAAKVWLEAERTLVVVPAPLAASLEERLAT